MEAHMQVSEDFDLNRTDALTLQIEELIHQDPELTQGEILMACMVVIGSVVKSIQCRDCRRLTANRVKKQMPKMVMAALAEATGQQDSQHHH
jgi:hypothetical protein